MRCDTATFSELSEQPKMDFEIEIFIHKTLFIDAVTNSYCLPRRREFILFRHQAGT